MEMSVRSFKKNLLLIGVLAIFALLIFEVLRTSSQPPPAPLPTPNGYEDFQRAIAARRGDPPDVQNASSVQDVSPQDLRSYLEKNREALELVRLGLSRECRVPVEYSQAYAARLLPELSGFKGLTILLRAEGLLAEKENRLSDAAKSYLDAMRFAHELSRGGVQISALVGIACEAIGMNPLQQLRSSLKADDCQKTARALEQVILKQEDFKTILTREKAWGRRAAGWTYPMQYLFTARLMKPAHDKLQQKLKDRETRRKLLMTELSIRAYQLENGTSPKALLDLVPRFLTALPIDPYSGTSFHYRPQSNGFEIYSVGPDGKDNNGAPMARGQGKDFPAGDLFLDSRY
jgi:hypothetical protein